MGLFRTRDFSFYAFLALAVLLFAGICHAQDEKKRCRYVNLETMPITFKNLQPTIDANVNGKPVPMVLDTGSVNTFLTRSAAEKLDIAIGSTLHSTAGVGGTTRLYVARLKTFSLGSLPADKISLFVASDTSVTNLNGLVGADFLFHHDVEFLLAEGKLRFFHPVGCENAFLAYWNAEAFVVPMEDGVGPHPDGLGRVFFGARTKDLRKVVIVELNGKPMRALIDSGAQHSAITLAAAARLGITPESPGVVAVAGTRGIGPSTAKTWVATLDSFAIGPEVIKNAKIFIVDLAREDAGFTATPPDMLLGADFLRAHRVLFAVSQRRLYFSYLGGGVFRIDDAEQTIKEK